MIALCDPFRGLRDENFGDSIAPCDFTPARNGSRVADACHVMTYTRRIDCAREKILITRYRKLDVLKRYANYVFVFWCKFSLWISSRSARINVTLFVSVGDYSSALSRVSRVSKNGGNERHTGRIFFVKFKISDLPYAFSRATCSEYLSVTYAYVWLLFRVPGCETLVLSASA